MITRRFRLAGRVRIAIREGDRLVRVFPWQKNLILDQGLDKFAAMPFNQVFTNCCIGTGSNPTSRDPGAAVTATISGSTLTASSAVFTSADLDGDVVFNSGQRFKIQSIVGASPSAQVTTFQSGTLATATHFVIQYTNQAILAGEVQRTGTLMGMPGANGTTINQANVIFQRTFLFDFEADPITYTEVGFSDQPTAGANLFSRVVLATPVSLSGPSAAIPSGQRLQVTYQLTVNFDYGQGPGVFFPGRTSVTIPVTNLPVNYSIWNYAASGSQTGQLAVTVQGFCPALIGSTITISGSSVSGYNGTFVVLDSASLTDSTHGLSTVLSLQVAYSATATGGTLTIPMTGAFFRGNQGVWVVNAGGLSSAPSPSLDAFWGQGEPSVAGNAWASPLIAQGSNGTPAALDQTQVYSVQTILQPYTAGSFHLDRIGNIPIGTLINNPNAGPVPVVSFGYGYPDQTNQVETWVWDQPHALAQGSTLGLTFRMSWSRS